MGRQDPGALREVEHVLGQHARPERPAPPEHVGKASRPAIAGPPVDPLVRGRSDGHETITSPAHGARKVEQGRLVEAQERSAAHALEPSVTAARRGWRGQVQVSSTARPLYWRASDASPWMASIGFAEPE